VVRVSDYGTILMKGGNSWEQKKLITHTLYIYIYIYIYIIQGLTLYLAKSPLCFRRLHQSKQ